MTTINILFKGKGKENEEFYVHPLHESASKEKLAHPMMHVLYISALKICWVSLESHSSISLLTLQPAVPLPKLRPLQLVIPPPPGTVWGAKVLLPVENTGVGSNQFFP